mgnify:FL=1
MTTPGLYHHIATCADCQFYVDARNAMAVAALHNKRTGHQVSCEVGWLWRREAVP